MLPGKIANMRIVKSPGMGLDESVLKAQKSGSVPQPLGPVRILGH